MLHLSRSQPQGSRPQPLTSGSGPPSHGPGVHSEGNQDRRGSKETKQQMCSQGDSEPRVVPDRPVTARSKMRTLTTCLSFSATRGPTAPLRLWEKFGLCARGPIRANFHSSCHGCSKLNCPNAMPLCEYKRKTFCAWNNVSYRE